MFTDALHWLDSNGQALQSLVVIVSLLWLAIQTRQVGRQLKLANITSLSQQFKDLNLLEMQNEGLRKIRHETVEGIYADYLEVLPDI